jgi:1-pyrroline-5-carboxylate dehydrogenase
MPEPFRLTYATMFNPPEHLHDSYDAAVADLKANLSREYGMIINGEERFSQEKFEDTSPIDAGIVLGIFQRGTAQDGRDAVAAAKAASRVWGRLPWQERVDLLRKAAGLIDERVYKFGAVLSMEVGKNRMEALADAAETADLIRYACDQMESNTGYIVEMDADPLQGYTARNVSVLRPYGVWAVISPFNFPAALTGGPAGAALVAGNTIVIKPASDTAYTVRLLAECFRDAGIPDGVFNYVTGGGSTIGQAIIDSPDVDGVTFTGSFDVGMRIYRSFAAGKYPRPTILEMGGKNPAVVSRNADLDRAAAGIIRSAFGLQGQKCSAASRIYIEEPVYDEMVDRLKEATEKLVIGDPTLRETFMGPVINKWAYNDFKNFTEDLSQNGDFLTGGKVLTEGDHGRGYFCSPTFVTGTPDDHKLWKHEMFLPISMIRKVGSLEEAMAYANDVDFGLTSGIYGSDDEVKWFFDNIESGVTYANRPQGATTGAWPGFQPFGGWKGSGSSGKNAGGHYYLPLYMHEQSRTVIV